MFKKKEQKTYYSLPVTSDNGGSDDSLPRLSRAEVDQLLLDPAGYCVFHLLLRIV